MNKVITQLFEKNLNSIKNLKLREKLVNYNPRNSVLLQNTNGYNLVFNNTFLHDVNSPLQEAKTIIENCKNCNSEINLIFGLGLGYLLQLGFRELKGKIILFEPELEIIYTAFNYVDFSKELSSEKVFVSDDFNEIKNELSRMKYIQTPTIISLKSYRDLYKQEFLNQAEEIKMLFGSIVSDYMYQARNFPNMTKFLIKNISKVINEKPLDSIKGIYSGKTALIIGAGPSLDDNIELIKKYRDKFTIFTVGTAMKTLSANNIKPDFLSVIEIVNCSKQFEGVDLSEINFIIEPYSNPLLHEVKAKKIYSHIAKNVVVNEIWSEISGIDISNYYSSGTVTFTAMDSARILGFSKIVAVGLDLAFSKERCYSKDSVYKDLVWELNKETNKLEIVAKDFESFKNSLLANGTEEAKIRVAKERIEQLNKNLFYVKGINGEMIPTNKEYALFIQHFTQYAKMFPDLELINTSRTGAEIAGFKNRDLETVLKDLPEMEPFNDDEEFHYDNSRIINKLDEILVRLEDLRIILNKNFQAVMSFLDAGGENTDELLIEAKKIIQEFEEFVNFNDSKILQYMVIKDYLEVTEKIDKLNMDSYEQIKGVLNSLVNYYKNGVDGVMQITSEIGLLKENLEGKLN